MTLRIVPRRLACRHEKTVQGLAAPHMGDFVTMLF